MLTIEIEEGREARVYTEIDIGLGQKEFPPPWELLRGGGKFWTVNSKHLASWISGNYFKGTNTAQLPCKYYFYLFYPSNKTSSKKHVLKIFIILLVSI